MGRQGEVIGSIGFMRSEPGGFSDDEMSLLKAFTDQAAIAVANARLLRQIEERNSDLSESLELQTATSEVLELISANPGDLRTVLDGICGRAIDLCGADSCAVVLRQGDVMRIETGVTQSGKPSREHEDLFGFEFSVDESGANLKAARTRRPVFLDDFQALTDQLGSEFAKLTTIRSFGTVALMQEGEWIGNLNIHRQEVRPFDEKQATILQAFADQAAIAVATPSCSTTSTPRSNDRPR